MRFSYKFGNILGSVYNSGTLEFFPDGNRLLSPVANKLLVFDLKNGKSEALSLELEYNLSNLCLSPNGSLLLATTEKTELYMISLISGSVLHRKQFKEIGDKINDLKFSYDGKYYAVCGSQQILVYLTPGFLLKGKGRQLSAFKIHKIIKSSFEETSCLSWSKDSKLLLIGSKDFTIRIYPIDREMKNVPKFVSLSGHSDLVSNAFFANNTPNELNIYSLSRNGQLFIWDSNYSSFDELSKHNEEKLLLNYRKEKTHYFNNDLQNSYSTTQLTTATYNNKMKLMVIGFSNGSFMLYEMPDITLIHSLQLSNNGPISSIAINNSGDWIAIGSSIGSGNKFDIESGTSSESQLIVWEWESQSFILKQTGYSSGLTNLCECIAYSPDATLLASGGSDGKIKIWNLFSGFCISTFTEEHKGPVTALDFVPGKNGKVLISASLDGTVKAFDLNRYRNFRTLAAPSESKAAQFISLAIDQLSGDFIACGAHNFFEIFLWSLQTGRLLECLAGHEAPVSGLKFSPITNTLVSCSWDRSVRIWDLFEGSKCTREVIKLGSDALAIAFRGDGHQFAVSTLNGNISFFDPKTAEQLGVGIEGKDDLGTAHYERDIVKDKEKYFSTLNYSVDGTYIIAGGKSKYVCIYHVIEKILVKKFTISCNLSMDGMYDYISKRKVQEFGFNLSLIKSRDENTSYAPISLPGVTKNDFSSRSINPIIAVYDIKFSPTMRTFAFASTEGIIIYTLDKANAFDPFQLETSITPMSVRSSLDSQQYSEALMQALKLNEQKLIVEVLESVPVSQIAFICKTFPVTYVEKCLRSIAIELESTKHIEFYLKWCQILLYQNANSIKNNMSIEMIAPTLRLLQQNLTLHFEDIGRICEHNKYIMRFIKILAQHKNREIVSDDSEEENSSEEMQ